MSHHKHVTLGSALSTGVTIAVARIVAEGVIADGVQRGIERAQQPGPVPIEAPTAKRGGFGAFVGLVFSIIRTLFFLGGLALFAAFVFAVVAHH